MEEVNVNGLTLKNIKVSENSGYKGYDIHFTFQGKLYSFLVANTEPLFPINILHKFKETGPCPLCNRTIYPYPIGQQPCMELKKMDRLLLDTFKKLIPTK